MSELTATSIPEAWQDGKTNAMAIATTLSTKRGLSLPWTTVKSAIDNAIRARWLVLSKESAAWPSDLAGAQHVVLQTAEVQAGGVAEDPGYSARPQGVLTAEADLEANGIQDLAEQIPELLAAAVGSNLKFSVRIEFGGETIPGEESD